MGYGRSYDIGVFGSNFGHTVTQNLPVLLKQNCECHRLQSTRCRGQISPLFILDDGPIAATFPAVPSDGITVCQLWVARSRGYHIRPTKQVLPLVDAWNVTVQHQAHQHN